MGPAASATWSWLERQTLWPSPDPALFATTTHPTAFLEMTDKLWTKYFSSTPGPSSCPFCTLGEEGHNGSHVPDSPASLSVLYTLCLPGSTCVALEGTLECFPPTELPKLLLTFLGGRRVMACLPLSLLSHLPSHMGPVTPCSFCCQGGHVDFVFYSVTITDLRPWTVG